MRVTDSNDGVKRVNMQVMHRVSGQDFIEALCFGQYEWGEGDLVDYGRDWILDAVRMVLKEHPDQINYWSDEIDEGDAETLRAWADELVRRRFPEMF